MSAPVMYRTVDKEVSSFWSRYVDHAPDRLTVSLAESAGRFHELLSLTCAPAVVLQIWMGISEHSSPNLGLQVDTHRIEAINKFKCAHA